MIERLAVRPLPLLLAVIISGCGLLEAGPGTGGGGVPGAPGDPNAPIGRPIDPDPAPGAAMLVEPDPAVVDPHVVRIERFILAPDGRTLRAEYWGGTEGCFAPAPPEVALRDGVPVVTVREGTRGAAVGQACIAIAVLKAVELELPAAILADSATPDPESLVPERSGAAQQVVVQPNVVDVRPHAVTGFVVSGDGLTLTVLYVGGTDTCYGLGAIDVDADVRPVPVAVFEGRLPRAGACDDIGVFKSVTISLPRALLVDASTQEA